MNHLNAELRIEPTGDIVISANNCPVCRVAAQFWHSVNGHPIFECPNCRHRFVRGMRTAQHVKDNFDDAYFLHGGAGYPNYIADCDILYNRGCRYARILARYMKPGQVLDVGAAAGFILRGLIDSGWSGRGIEPNRRMVEFGRKHLGLEVDCNNLENYRGSETFDLIAMFQSIMHFFDVRRACSVAARVTKPGGYWLIEAFNPHSWIGHLLGRHWHDYNPPSVLHWFSPFALRLLLREYGLEEIALGRAPKAVSAAHAKSVLRMKLGSGRLGRATLPFLALVPDRLRVPYPADDIFWALYRKRERG
jgi:SAM-dependent methyltransferase